MKSILQGDQNKTCRKFYRDICFWTVSKSFLLLIENNTKNWLHIFFCWNLTVWHEVWCMLRFIFSKTVHLTHKLYADSHICIHSVAHLLHINDVTNLHVNNAVQLIYKQWCKSPTRNNVTNLHVNNAIQLIHKQCCTCTHKQQRYTHTHNECFAPAQTQTRYGIPLDWLKFANYNYLHTSRIVCIRG